MLGKKIVTTVALGGLISGLIGCSSSGRSAYSSPDIDYPLTRAERIADAIEFYEEEITPAQERELLQARTLYFGFDRFDISPENRRIIFVHARKMLENPKLKLRVDGHTDAQGSREYNIALSERRAKAVAEVLALKGVARDRVVTLSYGKEKPAVIGNDEAAWSKNRRAELEYERS